MEIENKKFFVKWNKVTFNISTNKQTIEELKQEIQGLTNVLTERQKLLLKGKVFNNSDSINEIPENSTIVLLGNAESELIKTNLTEKVVFMEDLTNEERLKLLKERGEDLIFGLQNLGNTCYFNALIQSFGRVEPLREALKNYQFSNSGEQLNNLKGVFCKELGNVYTQLENSTSTVVPGKLVQILRTYNPAFGMQERGSYKQQDADECMTLMLEIFKNLKNPMQGEKYSDCLADELFQVSLDISLTNVEDQTEIKNSKDQSYKLICYIDNNTSELVSGLKNSLAENIDLYSEKLSRNTVFIKKQLISRLPPFLNIQFMRFFWKQADENMPDSKAGKAKILKSVMFSKMIDVFDLCSPEVQEVLKLGRDIETKMLKEDKDYRTDLSCQKKGENMIPTGRYQLIAVVTHQGRSSDSGHYIGWCHRKDDKWVKFDDDVVTYLKSQDILELKGGGDWHMAYICIYKALEVPFQ